MLPDIFVNLNYLNQLKEFGVDFGSAVHVGS